MTQVNTISPSQWNTLVDKHGWATAETMLKENNLKVAEAKMANDVKKAIANSTKKDADTFSSRIDKQMGIGKTVKSAENSPLASTRVMGKDGNLTKSAEARIEKHPNAKKAIKEAKAYKVREAARKAAEAERINKLKAEKSVFSTPGIFRKNDKLTKKGVSMMTPNSNAKEAIKEAKAYKAREAARKIAEKSRLAKAREHFKALKERVQSRINKSPFAQKGILAEGGELTKKGKAAMTTHSNAQAAIDGAKAYAEREAARKAKWAEGAAARADYMKALRERCKNALNKVVKTPANAADAVETAGRTTTQGMQEAVETAVETSAKNPLVKKIVIGALATAAVIGTILAVNKKDNAEAKEAA